MKKIVIIFLILSFLLIGCKPIVEIGYIEMGNILFFAWIVFLVAITTIIEIVDRKRKK